MSKDPAISFDPADYEDNEEQNQDTDVQSTNTLATTNSNTETVDYANYYPYYYPPAATEPVKNVYVTRPARKQVKKGSGPQRPEFTHHSSDYNIWYGKKLGDRFEKEERLKATTRCCVATDSGYTRADKANKDTWICLYFARGHCSHGAECNYHHRIPTEGDEAKADMLHDCFGRERHRTYRDDMGGVGSFARENKSLYITGFKKFNCNEEVITRHFAEWGQLEAVRMIHEKAIAFVRYTLRASAEFAKEAMQDQSLDNDEVLLIKWANDDPNPTSVAREEENQVQQLAETVALKRTEEDPLYQYGEGQGESGGYDYFPSQENPSQYPNTNQQFSGYTNSNKVVSDWLKKLDSKTGSNDLIKYTDLLLSAGYFDTETLAQLDEIGLDAVGVNNAQHRVALLKGASEQAAEEQKKAALKQKQQTAQSYNIDPYQQYYYNTEYMGADPNDGEETQEPSLEQYAQASNQQAQQKATPSAGLVDYGSDDDE